MSATASGTIAGGPSDPISCPPWMASLTECKEKTNCHTVSHVKRQWVIFPVSIQRWCARFGEHAQSQHSARGPKLRQSGSSISHETAARWRRRGWRPLEREQHPLEVAREQLDDAAPLLTRDPVAEDLNESAEPAELEAVPDGELLRRARPRRQRP